MVIMMSIISGWSMKLSVISQMGYMDYFLIVWDL